MKRVLLRGPLLTHSGYAVHARQFARYLFAREATLGFETSCQVLPWGNTPWILDEDEHDGLIGEIMKRTRDPGGKFDLSVQVQLPNEWDTSIAPRNVGVSAVVETDRCNPEWVKACNRMTHVIVPSEHAARTLRASEKLDVPLSVVPEPYGPSLLVPADRLPSLPLEFAQGFNFLIIGQLSGGDESTDRKGTMAAVRWLCEEFVGDPNVGIFVKTNMGRNSVVDRHHTEDVIGTIARAARGSSPFPRVTLLHGKMSDLEMAALYRHPRMGAFVCPTRGEGFGLPVLEAAVSGLPVISTAWSGQTEILSAGRTIPIEYSLVEIPKVKVDGRIFVEGARWAQPDVADFKRKARKISSSSSIPRGWAKDMAEKLKVSHSVEALEQQIDGILGGMLT